MRHLNQALHLALALLASVAFLSAPVSAQDSEKTVLDFEGGEVEGYVVSGTPTAERSPSLVKSGIQSLRITFAKPTVLPSLTISKQILQVRGARSIRLDVYNPQEKSVSLGVRIDDAKSRATEAELHRSPRRMEPGWNELSISLMDLRTTSGSRLLDPEDLTSVTFYVFSQPQPIDLIFDRLRVSFVADAGSPEAEARTYKAFEDGFPNANPAQRTLLIQSLREYDTGRRIKILDQVLANEPSALLVDDAIGIAGRSRTDESIAEAIVRTRKAVTTHRWRWIDALGRMPGLAAREWLLTLAKDRRSPPDQVAAIGALMRRDATALIPELVSHKDDPWQVRSARIEALRVIRTGDAIGGLIPFLKDGNARIRDDANNALVVLAGRDLGEDTGAWTRWWEANRATFDPDAKGPKGQRSAYGSSSFYGVPVLPGRIAFAIDLSGSMKEKLTAAAKAYAAKAPHLREKRLETRLDLAKEELQHTIATLPPRTAFQLVFFGTEISSWKNGRILDADDETRADALKRVRGLNPMGSTNIHGALVKAFYPDPDWTFTENFSQGIDTIFLLTDGEPSSGAIVNATALLADIRDRNRVRRIKIHTIGVGLPNSLFLRALAQQSGGTYVDLAKP